MSAWHALPGCQRPCVPTRDTEIVRDSHLRCRIPPRITLADSNLRDRHMPRLPEGITRLSFSDFVAPPDAPEGWSPAEANAESWRLFKTAEIIFGYDSTTENAFVV